MRGKVESVGTRHHDLLHNRRVQEEESVACMSCQMIPNHQFQEGGGQARAKLRIQFIEGDPYATQDPIIFIQQNPKRFTVH